MTAARLEHRDAPAAFRPRAPGAGKRRITFLVPVRHFISPKTYTADFKRFVAGGEGLDLRVVRDARPLECRLVDRRLHGGRQSVAAVVTLLSLDVAR